MLQEEYKLGLGAGLEAFMTGVDMLLKQKAAESERRGDSAIYIHLLLLTMDRKITEKVCAKIADIMPQAVVTGMAENLLGEMKETATIRFNFTFFRTGHAELIVREGCDGDYAEAGRKLGKKIAAVPHVKAAAIYCTGMTTRLHQLTNAMAEGNEALVIFGTTVGLLDYRDERPLECTNIFSFNKLNKVEHQYIVGGKVIYSGVVVVVFAGSDLHVRGDYVLGWKPLGKELTITKTAEDNCIETIEGRPAVDVYKRYLNVVPDDNFVYNIAEFPLVIKRKGRLLARVPPRYDENGRLFFSGDVYTGEKLRLSYAVNEEMLQETENYSDAMCGFAPESLFITICAFRNIFLRSKAGHEIDWYRRFAPNMVINYGTSELYWQGGSGGFLNSALVAVGMREGEPHPHACYMDIIHKAPEHRIIPLSERMAFFIGTVTKELAESNQELMLMAQKAEAASKAKSQFLSGMSHEIRTPINAVLGMDEMILRETQESFTREYATNIRTAGTALLGIVNDILDFSKIEAGKMEIIPVEYAASSILNDLVNMIRQRAEKKGLALHVEVPEDFPSILKGDEIRLRQVVTNILTNAVKYTEKGSVTLSVSYRREDDNHIQLTIAIKDTGIGIKEDDIEKLFHAFERIEEERNRTIEGTGLGMNITQKLLEMMGSTLEVASTYGEGSEFVFTVRQEVLNWSPMGNYEESYRRMVAAQTAYKESFVAPDAKILVVDDTAMNLTVVKGLLKQTQVQVDTAMSGYECLKMAKENVYDVIFLDHRMPGLDGVETLQRLQQLGQGADFPNKHTPVVALTANAVSGAREEYMAAGFDDYLTKPIDSHKLEEMLHRLLPQEKVRAAGGLPQAQEEKLPDWLEYVVGLEPHKGVEHCGSVAAYMDALKVFAQSIESNADEIQRYYDTGDWDNYTTKVHALKSTARVIGAMELSEKARRLEDAGNNCYRDEIEAGTAPLLDLYRSYTGSLSMLLPAEDAAQEKAPISSAELAEAWQALAEIVASFDFDSLDYMLGELSGYQLPEADAEKLAQIKKAAAVPDWAALQSLLAK